MAERALRNRLPVAGLLLLFASSAAQGQDAWSLPEGDADREPNFGVYAAEAAGGLIGGLAGFVAGGLFGAYLFYTPARDMSAVEGATLVGTPVAVVGCAAGTYGMGSAFRQEGRFLPTLAWGVGSTIAGLGIYCGGVALMNRTNGPEAVWNLGAGLMCFSWVVPVVLTTVGYNLSRGGIPFSGRVLPGSVALRAAKDAGGAVHPSLEVRLLYVRF